MAVKYRVSQDVQPLSAFLATVSPDSLVRVPILAYQKRSTMLALCHFIGVQECRFLHLIKMRMAMIVVTFSTLVYEGL